MLLFVSRFFATLLGFPTFCYFALPIAKYIDSQEWQYTAGKIIKQYVAFGQNNDIQGNVVQCHPLFL